MVNFIKSMPLLAALGCTSGEPRLLPDPEHEFVEYLSDRQATFVNLADPDENIRYRPDRGDVGFIWQNEYEQPALSQFTQFKFSHPAYDPTDLFITAMADIPIDSWEEGDDIIIHFEEGAWLLQVDGCELDLRISFESDLSSEFAECSGRNVIFDDDGTPHFAVTTILESLDSYISDIECAQNTAFFRALLSSASGRVDWICIQLEFTPDEIIESEEESSDEIRVDPNPIPI